MFSAGQVVDDNSYYCSVKPLRPGRERVVAKKSKKRVIKDITILQIT